MVNGVSIDEYDLVYIRDFHGYEPERNTIADYCKKNGVVFANQDTAVSQKISKLAQYMIFASHDIPFPESVYAHTSRLAQAAEETLAYPMIVKSILASSGDDNYYVESREQLDEILSRHADQKFIAQEAVPNEGDFRIVTLGDRALTVYRRVAASGDHRNNVSKGGDSQYISHEDTPDGMHDIALKVSRAVGRDVCGVDVMVDTRDESMVVLEANFNFGVTTAPEGLFDAMAEYFHDQATRKK
jgi:glutathione synthase/RimK-type ligase-like ATP-grasp enzyme